MRPQLNQIQARPMIAFPARRPVIVALVHITKASGFKFREIVVPRTGLALLRTVKQEGPASGAFQCIK
jgi:hypothetical protein